MGRMSEATRGETENLNVVRVNVMGSPNIGVFAKATESYALFPQGIPQRKLDRFSSILKVKVLSFDIAQSKLIGVLMAANSKGIIVPHYTTEEEIKFLRENLKVEVERLKSKYTSVGNLILVNDKGCLLYTSPSPRDLSTSRMPSSA